MDLTLLPVLTHPGLPVMESWRQSKYSEHDHFNSQIQEQIRPVRSSNWKVFEQHVSRVLFSVGNKATNKHMILPVVL